jgi:deazaflavin-dependent oxidoreductase (nitroreductase family)
MSTMPASESSVHPFNQPIVAEFSANCGVVGGVFAGADLLLLTMVGARSGRLVTSPLGCVRDGDRLLVVASAAGSPRHPAWYHNLRANPTARVELGGDVLTVRAVITEDAKRDALFAMITDRASGYRDRQSRVRRTIPVVALVPAQQQDPR